MNGHTKNCQLCCCWCRNDLVHCNVEVATEKRNDLEMVVERRSKRQELLIRLICHSPKLNASGLTTQELNGAKGIVDQIREPIHLPHTS